MVRGTVIPPWPSNLSPAWSTMLLLPVLGSLLCCLVRSSEGNKEKEGDSFSMRKEEIYSVVSRIESKCLPSEQLSDSLSYEEQVLLFRAWHSSTAIPLQLAYKKSIKAGLVLSPSQDRGQELIELAKLTSNLHILHAGKTLAFKEWRPLTICSSALIRSTPSYRHKYLFLDKHVYRSRASTGLRLLTRAMSYVIFNSLGHVLRSEKIAKIPFFRLSQQNVRMAETFASSTAVSEDYLRHCLEWVGTHEHNMDTSNYGAVLSSVLAMALNIERASYDEYLGDILTVDQMDLFSRNLKKLGVRVARIIGSNFNPADDEPFEDYFNL